MGINFEKDFKPREAIKYVDKGFHLVHEKVDEHAGLIRKYAGGSWVDQPNLEVVRKSLEEGATVLCVSQEDGSSRQVCKADVWLADKIYARHEREMAAWLALEAVSKGESIDQILAEAEQKAVSPRRRARAPVED